MFGAKEDLAVATFAGGCFWSMEAAFDEVSGVVSTTSGYAGGRKDTPSHKVVLGNGAPPAEAVQIKYDPRRVSYQQLLHVFWVNHDPTTDDRQFCDKGRRYRPAIYYHNDAQKRLAEQSRRQVMKNYSFTVLTEITRVSEFHAAEASHQNYKEKNPVRYNLYRAACGRDARLEELWGWSVTVGAE